MVGSTALSTRLDPEELRELLSEYHARVTEATARHGRFVARYMGDGVLAYFGWPTADESDAERAVRAGLAIIEAVRSTRSSARSRIRPGSRAMTRCRGNPRNLPPSWRREGVRRTVPLARMSRGRAPGIDIGVCLGLSLGPPAIAGVQSKRGGSSPTLQRICNLQGGRRLRGCRRCGRYRSAHGRRADSNSPRKTGAVSMASDVRTAADGNFAVSIYRMLDRARRCHARPLRSGTTACCGASPINSAVRFATASAAASNTASAEWT
jgi:hypothetical protein